MNEQKPKKDPLHVCEETGEVSESTWLSLDSFRRLLKALSTTGADPTPQFLFLNEAQLTMTAFYGCDTSSMLTYAEYSMYLRDKCFSSSFWEGRANRSQKQIRAIHRQVRSASFFNRLRYLFTRKLRLVPEWERADSEEESNEQGPQE